MPDTDPETGPADTVREGDWRTVGGNWTLEQAAQ